MSDDPKTPEPTSPTQEASPAPPTPTPAPAPADAPSTAAPQTPDPKPQIPSTGSRPPIDYALPSQKQSWLPTPAMIRNIGCLLKLIVGFTVLICMGYFALVALNPKARQWALQGSQPGPGGTPASGKGPTPFKALNQVLAIPAQAMGKTDDVVKANNARVGQLDGVIKDEEDKTKGGKAGRTFAPVSDPFASGGKADPKKASGNAANTDKPDGPQSVSRESLLALAEKNGATVPPPAADLPSPNSNLRPATPAPAAPDAPDQIKLAGDIVIAQAPGEGIPRASRAFFYWVVSLSPSGITQSKPARMLLNNRLVHEGDEVNRALGITFVELNPITKQLVFRDKTGATVTRSY